MRSVMECCGAIGLMRVMSVVVLPRAVAIYVRSRTAR